MAYQRKKPENILERCFEEIDGCELSISSFLVAEFNGQIVAAIGAWIEGIQGVPSNVLKGNLLNFILPKRCIERAVTMNKILSEVHIEYVPNTIQIGVVYVESEFRGINLVSNLIEKQIFHLTLNQTIIPDAYVQVFGNNLPAIRAYERSNFKVQLIKKSRSKEISNYLPSNQKILMKREGTTK